MKIEDMKSNGWGLGQDQAWCMVHSWCCDNGMDLFDEHLKNLNGPQSICTWIQSLKDRIAELEANKRTPSIEPAETFPRFWTTNSPNIIAYLEQISETEVVIVEKDGSRNEPLSWFSYSVGTERTRLTEQQALELLDWVPLTDPEHVLREGIDWRNFEGEGWEPVDTLDGCRVGKCYHGNKFRCLRKDLPPIDEQPDINHIQFEKYGTMQVKYEPSPAQDPIELSTGLVAGPQKRRVRLYWYDGNIVGRYIDCEPTDESFIELKHDAEGFYVEESQ